MLISTLEITGAVLGICGAISLRIHLASAFCFWLASSASLMVWAAVTSSWGIFALFWCYFVMSTFSLIGVLRKERSKGK